MTMQSDSTSMGSGSIAPPMNLNSTMQYTALTSITPVSSAAAIARIPNITQQTDIFQLSEQQTIQSRQTYDLLNTLPQNEQHAAFIQSHIQSLQNYLTTSDFQKLKFQIPAVYASLPSTNGPITRNVQAFGLSNFPEQVLLNADVPFESTDPPTNGPQFNIAQIPLPDLFRTLHNAPLFLPLPVSHQSTPAPTQNNEDKSEHAALTEHISASLPPLTTQDATIFPQLLQPIEASGSLVLPETSSLTVSDLSFAKDATTVTEPSPIPRQRSPKKRKSPTAQSPSPSKIVKIKIKRVDQSEQKNKAIVDDLQNLIDSVFDADDDVEKDTSGVNGRFSSLWVVGSSESEPLLANDCQIRLEGTIHRVIHSSVYSSIAVDDVLRLQRICIRSVRHAVTISWKGLDGLANHDSDNVFSDISAADNALKACKTLIRTMLGSRDDNRICSEDIMKEIADFISNLIESLLVPLISPITVMNSIMQYKKLIVGLLQETARTLTLLYKLLLIQDLSETVITRLEFISISIIFVENATKERESFLGIANVEGLRVATVDILAHIFSAYRDQRTFILSEILSSLEKLPIQRLSARQYRLIGGGNIQLVTALILRLIQTAGSLDLRTLRQSTVENFSMDVMKTDNQVLEAKSREELVSMCQKCNAEAFKSATDVVNFLVDRAMKSTKSGDAPYRVLLDLFTEDFITVLELPEWPGAEMLLRCLAMQMIGCIGDSYSAQVNSMALDILGAIGSKLQDWRIRFPGAIELSASSSKNEFEEVDVLAMAVLLYLYKSSQVDMTAKSSYGYFFAAWTVTVSTFAESETSAASVSNTVHRLAVAANDDTWASKEDFAEETNQSAKHKNARVLVQMPLYKLYDRILSEISRSLDSPRIVSRTKALRVLAILLAKDPSIMSNTNVMAALSSRLRDQSAQVRDAAVDVVGKYVLFKPEVTKSYYMLICDRAGDTGTGVRRRVLKLLKDVFLATSDIEIKLEIADRLLRRLEDVDPGVLAVAKKTLEELWFGPTDSSLETDEFAMKSEIESRLAILLQTREKSDKTARLIQVLAQGVFEADDKSAAAVEQANIVAKAMVNSLFETVVDWNDSKQVSQRTYFGLLSTFAIANKSLFEADQLVILQTYLQDTKEDASTYYVLVIFRQILPFTGTLRTKMLVEVQQTLLTRLSRFNLRELSEAVPCLWDTSVMLKDTRRLATTAVSCLNVIAQYKVQAKEGKLATADMKLMRLLHLLGHIGRYCNLEEHVSMFRTVNAIHGRNVTEMLVLTMQMFAQPRVISTIRRIAVRNLGMICISHPQIFMATTVMDVFDTALTKGDREIRETVVQLFSEFLTYEQDRADRAVKQRGGADIEVDVQVLKGESANNANDSVCASLVQRYLDSILEITLASEDGYALSAVLLLEKVVRQGYPNPRNCVPTLIALEISAHPAIRALAYDLHQKLHEKHESLIEGCYIEGVRKSVKFERAMEDLQPDRPVSDQGMVPLYSVIKSSRVARKRFLSGLTKAMDFNLSKLLGNPITAAIEHLKFVGYIARNLPCVELSTSEEPLTVVFGLDQIMASTGMSALYTITESMESADVPAVDSSDHGSSHRELANLAACCAILFTIWELRQHLRRLYSLSEQDCRSYQSSKSIKDLKSISKSSGIDEHLRLQPFCLQDSFDDEAQALTILDQTKVILAAAEPVTNV
ncbi:sister chromatid cohesion C-terminus-domain-containing protein [Lipomyces arxii]|uniref:sister chromatid cohesion C-terminus-domain-containing protein n=1 Tax=Lipomyces arxii TaxID=56418 RepID=UPI0034CD4F20